MRYPRALIMPPSVAFDLHRSGDISPKLHSYTCEKCGDGFDDFDTRQVCKETLFQQAEYESICPNCGAWGTVYDHPETITLKARKRYRIHLNQRPRMAA